LEKKDGRRINLKEITDKYKTVINHYSTEIKINKSVFISDLFPVQSSEEIKKNLNLTKNKYHDANHHTFAYRLGLDKNNFKCNDDGEPSGSSGKPILEAIDKFELTDVLIIVTRYFGGVKLGIGGLKRAYFQSAGECIQNQNIIEKYITKKISAKFEYGFLNPVMHYFEKEKIKILENNSDESVKLIFELRLSLIEKTIKELNNLTKGSIIIKN
jgi:uncharacterized YigZ family protein